MTVADHTLLMTCHWWLTPESVSPQVLPPSRTCSAATHLDTYISTVWSSRHSCEAHQTRKTHWKNLHTSISKQRRRSICSKKSQAPIFVYGYRPSRLWLHLIHCNLHSPIVHTAMSLPHPNSAHTDAAQKSCERHNTKHAQLLARSALIKWVHVWEHVSLGSCF